MAGETGAAPEAARGHRGIPLLLITVDDVGGRRPDPAPHRLHPQEADEIGGDALDRITGIAALLHQVVRDSLGSWSGGHRRSPSRLSPTSLAVEHLRELVTVPLGCMVGALVLDPGVGVDHG